MRSRHVSLYVEGGFISAKPVNVAIDGSVLAEMLFRYLYCVRVDRGTERNRVHGKLKRRGELMVDGFNNLVIIILFEFIFELFVCFLVPLLSVSVF